MEDHLKRRVRLVQQRSVLELEFLLGGAYWRSMYSHAHGDHKSLQPLKNSLSTARKLLTAVVAAMLLITVTGNAAHAAPRTLCWKGGINGLIDGELSDGFWEDVTGSTPAPGASYCSSVTNCSGSNTLNPGGPPGITSEDTLVFSSGCTNSARYQGSPNVAAIIIEAGYTGTFQANSNTDSLTVQGNFTQNGGTFNARGGSLTINGNFEMQEDPSATDSTVFTASSGTTQILGNLSKDADSQFNHNSGTLQLDNFTDQSISGSFSFYNLTKGAIDLDPDNPDPDGRFLRFAGGSQITVSGELNLAGLYPLMLTLERGSGAGSWSLNYTGTLEPRLENLNISNGTATSALNACESDSCGATSTCRSNCALAGTCTGWTFQCPPTPTATPTETSTETPTDTPTSTPTDTPTTTPTVTWTPTATPTQLVGNESTATATPTSLPAGVVSVSVRILIEETPIAALPVRIEGQSSNPDAALPITDDNGVAVQSVQQSDTVTISSGLSAINFEPISGAGGVLAARSPIEVQAERLIQPGTPCRRAIYDTGEEVVFPFINLKEFPLVVENAVPLNTLMREGGELVNTQPPREFPAGVGLFSNALSEFTSSDPNNTRVTAQWSFLGTDQIFSFDPSTEANPLPLCEGRATLPCVALSDKAARLVLTTTSNYFGRLRRLEAQLQRKYPRENKGLSFKRNRDRSYAKIKAIVTSAQKRSSSCVSGKVSCKQETISKTEMQKVFFAGFRPRPPRGRDPFRQLRRESQRALQGALRQVPDFVVGCD